MSSMVVVYARKGGLFAWLVRAVQWFAPWSHCGIVTPQRTVIEATMRRGVVETPLDDFLARYAEYECVRIDCPRPEFAVGWARQRVGAGYDFGAVATFILKRFGPGDDRERYHCVELVEQALRVGGRDRFRVKPHRLTVTQSYQVN